MGISGALSNLTIGGALVLLFFFLIALFGRR